MFVTKITNAKIDYYLIICIKEPMVSFEIKFPKELDIGNFNYEISMAPKYKKDSLEEESIILEKIIKIIEEKCDVFLNVETLEVVDKREIINRLKEM